MVIISLVVAGVAVALDKIEKRQAAKAEQESRNQEQILVSAEATRKRLEEEAFNELQNYADFQDFLCSKVLDDLEAESIAPPDYESSFLPNQELNARYLLPSVSTTDETSSRLSKSGLSCPVIIPQEISDSGTCSWSRVYTPSLMECGINQTSFLEFLDSFNEFVKTSPDLNAINITGLSENSWQEFLLGLSTAIPTALQQAKSLQADMRSNTFLNHANTLFFAPHGLCALIVSSCSSEPSPILNVNFNSTPITVHTAGESSPSEAPASSSLTVAHPALRPAPPSIKKSSKFRKMGNFITDYSDRRLQASQQHQHRFSAFLSNPPLNSTSLHSLVTNMSLSHSEPQSQSRSKRIVDSRRLRRRREVRSSASTSSLTSSRAATSTNRISASMITDIEFMEGLSMTGRSIGSAVMEGGEADGEIEEIGGGGGGIQLGAIYLVIVNDPGYSYDQGGGDGDDGRQGHVDDMDVWHHDRKGKGRDTKISF